MAAPLPLGVLDALWWHSADSGGKWGPERASLRPVELHFLSPSPTQIASPALQDSLRAARCIVFLGSVRNADPETTIVYGPYRVGGTDYAAVADSDRPGMALMVQLAGALSRWRTAVIRRGPTEDGEAGARSLVPLAENRTGLVGTGTFFRVANSMMPVTSTEGRRAGTAGYAFASVRDFLANVPGFRDRETPVLMHVLADAVDPTNWSWSELARAFWDVAAQATHRWIFSMTRTRLAILRIEPVVVGGGDGDESPTPVHIFDPPIYARVHPDVDMLGLLVGIRGARRYTLAPSLAGARPWLQQSGSTLDALRYTQEWMLQGALRYPLRVHTKLVIARPVTRTLELFQQAALEATEHVQLPIFTGMDLPDLLRKYMPRLAEAEATVVARDAELAKEAKRSAEMTQKVTTLKRKLAAARTTLDTVRSERKAYERELQKATATYEGARKTAAEYTRELERQLDRQTVLHAALKKQLAASEERHKTALAQLTSATATADDTIAAANARANAAQAQLDTARAQLAQCEQELADARQARSTLETELGVARVELSAARTAAQETLARLQSLSEARAEALQRAATLEGELSRAQDEIADDKERIGRLESEYRTALADVEIFDRYATELQEARDAAIKAASTAAGDAVADVLARMRQRIQQSSELKLRLRDAEESQREAEARLKRAEEALQQTTQDNVTLRENVATASADLEAANAGRKRAEHLAAGLRSLLEKEERKLAPVLETLRVTTARAIADETRIEQLESELEQCKSREASLLQGAAQLEAETAQQQERIEQLTRERDALVGEKQRVTTELQQAKTSYAELAEKERDTARDLERIRSARDDAEAALERLQAEFDETKTILEREIALQKEFVQQREEDVDVLDRKLRDLTADMATFLTEFASAREFKVQMADDYKRLYKEYLVGLERVAKKHLTSLAPLADRPSAILDPNSLASQLELMHIRFSPVVFSAMRSSYSDLVHVKAHEFYVQTRQTRPMDTRDVATDASAYEFARIVQYKSTDTQGASLDAIVSTDAVRGLLYQEIFAEEQQQQQQGRATVRLHLRPNTPAPVFRLDLATEIAKPINPEDVRRHPHYKQWTVAAKEMARTAAHEDDDDNNNKDTTFALPVFAVWRSPHTRRLEPNDVVYATGDSIPQSADIPIPRQGYLYLPRSPLFGEARAFAYKLPTPSRVGLVRRLSATDPLANISIAMHADVVSVPTENRVVWRLVALYISPVVLAVAAAASPPQQQ